MNVRLCAFQYILHLELSLYSIVYKIHFYTVFLNQSKKKRITYIHEINA